jgi:hypothetical protein
MNHRAEPFITAVRSISSRKWGSISGSVYCPPRLAYEDCHHSLDGNVLEAGNKVTIGERFALGKHVYQFIFSALQYIYLAPQHISHFPILFYNLYDHHDLIL